MSEESAIKQQVKEMARLSILANRISETQEKNLKHFPFVFFNDVRSVQIDYDLRDKQTEKEDDSINHRVTYRLDLDDKTNGSFLDKRFLCLEEAVRVLFWKDIKVELFFNGTKVRESKNVGK